jgi:hypothetical protein
MIVGKKVCTGLMGAGLLFTGPALAVDLAGKTILAEGISERADYNGADKTFTYPLEIYFSTKGNRFVLMKGTSGNTRVLIKAGEDRGSRRRKDGNFNQIISIQQSASSLQVEVESRGTTDGYAGEGFYFEVSFSGSSCRVNEFRYSPDPRQYLSKSYSKEGTCELSEGVPPGIEEQ